METDGILLRGWSKRDADEKNREKYEKYRSIKKELGFELQYSVQRVIGEDGQERLIILYPGNTRKIYAISGATPFSIKKPATSLLGVGDNGKVKLAQALLVTPQGVLTGGKILAAKITGKKDETEHVLTKIVQRYYGSSERISDFQLHQQSYHKKFYLVSDFVEGVTMREFLSNPNVSNSEKLMALFALLKELKKIQEKYKIVHGDLHFGNVLVSKNDDQSIYVEIIDFSSLGGKTDGNGEITFAPFMPHEIHPPECAIGVGGYPIDIYSFGVEIDQYLNKLNIDRRVADGLKSLCRKMSNRVSIVRPKIDKCIEEFNDLMIKQNVLEERLDMLESLCSGDNTYIYKSRILYIAAKYNKQTVLKRLLTMWKNAGAETLVLAAAMQDKEVIDLLLSNGVLLEDAIAIARERNDFDLIAFLNSLNTQKHQKQIIDMSDMDLTQHISKYAKSLHEQLKILSEQYKTIPSMNEDAPVGIDDLWTPAPVATDQQTISPEGSSNRDSPKREEALFGTENDNGRKLFFHSKSLVIDIEQVKQLLRQPNVDINFVEPATRQTPLHIAAQRGEVTLVAELLKHPNIDVNIPNKRGKTAIQLAQEYSVNKPLSKQQEYQQVIDLIKKHGKQLYSKSTSTATVAKLPTSKLKLSDLLLLNKVKPSDPVFTMKPNVSEQTAVNLSDTRNVVMFTAAIHGTSGDPSAAAKLMQSLIKESGGKIKFTWIVLRDPHSTGVDVKKFIQDELGVQNPNIELIVVDNEQTTMRKKFWEMPTCTEALKKSSTICIFPTHIFNKSDIAPFVGLQKPIINISEYDLEVQLDASFRRSSQNYTSYYTGLGSRSTGIFIEDPMTMPQYKLENLTALEPDNQTFRKLLYDPRPETYLQGHWLFLGYFNDSTSDQSSIINKHSFIIACIRNALLESQNKKTVDLFVNINYEDLIQLIRIIRSSPGILTPQELQLLSGSIEYVDKQGVTRFLTLHTNTTSISPIKIRVLNGFPVKKPSMQCLMQNSDPFIGLTGDQSLTEGLMYKKLICYQLMPWKTGLFNALIQSCQAACGVNCALCQFYRLQLKGQYSNSVVDMNNLIMFYNQHKDILQTQAIGFSKYLVENKSIGRVLVPKLIADIERHHRTIATTSNKKAR